MITCNAVRKLALSLPEVQEQDHWGRPSFRVRGKIFATLWPDERRAVLKLSLRDQRALARAEPETFSVGAWGKQGYTRVELDNVDRGDFREVLVEAWRQVAPKRVIAAYDAGAEKHE